MGHTISEFLSTLPEPLKLRGTNPDGTYTSVSQAREQIRKDLSAAIKAGVLGGTEKVSVRGDHNSVTVEIVAWSGRIFCDEYQAHLMDPTSKWDPDAAWAERRSRGDISRRFGGEKVGDELAAALAVIEKIANRHNYDNSRIEVDYFDVGYYLHVSARTVEANAEAAIRMEGNPALAALLRKAKIAGDAVGKACCKSILGRAGIDGSSEWGLSSLIRLAIRTGCVVVTSGKVPDSRDYLGADFEIGIPEQKPTLYYDKRRGWQVKESEGVAA